MTVGQMFVSSKFTLVSKARQTLSARKQAASAQGMVVCRFHRVFNFVDQRSEMDGAPRSHNE
jgi:hypothetical protein